MVIKAQRSWLQSLRTIDIVRTNTGQPEQSVRKNAAITTVSQDKHCLALHCHVCRNPQDLGVEVVEFLERWAVSGRLLGFAWLGDTVS